MASDHAVVAVVYLAVGLVVNPAVRRVALVGVLAEDALALYARLGVDYVLAERGHGGEGLEGGAGGVGAQERVVVERLGHVWVVGVLGYLLVVVGVVYP